MRTSTRVTGLALLGVLALPALAGCGGDDASTDGGQGGSGSGSGGGAGSPSASASSPSASASVDSQSIGLDAQGIGLAVGSWSVKHDFALPADQADFTAKITYPDIDLAPGSKVGYARTGPKRFEVCVVQYDGSDPLGWGLYDSVSGKETDATGAPTSDTCP